MRIYLAGPLGFSEAGRVYQYGTIIPELQRLGHEVIDPWRSTSQEKIDAILSMPYGVEKREAWKGLNRVIGANNQAGIDRSDAVLAVLDGVDVDSGTASEIGYAFANNRPIIGYRGDFRLSADNEGSTVNLQVEYFIRQSGGNIITSLADLSTALDNIKSKEGTTCAETAAGPLSAAVGATPSAGGASAAPPPSSVKEKETSAVIGVITLLLALVVRAALETVLKPIFDHSQTWWHTVWSFGGAQFLTFFLMTLRFWLGAIRFGDVEAAKWPFLIKAANFVFAFILFCNFYAAALAVEQPAYFFNAIVALHIFDAVWFGSVLVLFWLRRVGDHLLNSGEVTTSAARRLMIVFLALDVVTLALAAALYSWWGLSPTCFWVFLSGLMVLSVADFTLLRKYYFHHSQWVAENSV